MTHLTSDELVDAVEGALGSSGHSHLASCESCRREVDRLGVTLAAARAVSIPEPSPLFWDHFSTRVRQAIVDEPAVRPWPLWLRWPVLVPLAALGLLVIALITAVPLTPRQTSPAVATMAVPPSEPEADAAIDSAWAFILESVGPLDVDMAHEAGIVSGPGEAERAALQLTDAEQVELVRLLEQELTRAGS
jgi:hypothetical protein